jgi:hypothetical protein
MPDYAKRMEIGKVLKEQLDQAYSAHLSASSKFDSLIKGAPSVLPHPDGSLRIQQAGNEARAALNEYMTALKRYSDFTISGVDPEDLNGPA